MTSPGLPRAGRLRHSLTMSTKSLTAATTGSAGDGTTPGRVASARVTGERVTAVREFNRFYTNVLGLLREGLLDTPYSLTEARVSWRARTRLTPGRCAAGWTSTPAT